MFTSDPLDDLSGIDPVDFEDDGDEFGEEEEFGDELGLFTFFDDETCDEDDEWIYIMSPADNGITPSPLLIPEQELHDLPVHQTEDDLDDIEQDLDASSGFEGKSLQ